MLYVVSHSSSPGELRCKQVIELENSCWFVTFLFIPELLFCWLAHFLLNNSLCTYLEGLKVIIFYLTK